MNAKLVAIIAWVVIAGAIIILSQSDFAFGETTENIKGKSYDEVRTYLTPDVYRAVWASAPERMFDYNDFQDKPVYVDFKTWTDANKIYFESEKLTLIFDKPTCSLANYDGGKLAGQQAKSYFSHTVKTAINGTDIWTDDIANDLACDVSYSETLHGIQIVASKGDFKTIYDIDYRIGFEWTYEYTNNDSTKTNQKWGFTLSCDGSDCGAVAINDVSMNEGETKSKDEIINKNIKIGNKGLDLKNNQHDYAWAMTKTSPTKMHVDFTHSKGKLAVGDTLIVDPTYEEIPDDRSLMFTNSGTIACDLRDDTGITENTNQEVFKRNGATSCQAQWMEWTDLDVIPTSATVDSAYFEWDNTASALVNENCTLRAYEFQPSTRTAQQRWNDGWAGVMLNSTGTGLCYNDGTNYQLEFDATGISNLQDNITGDEGWYGGFMQFMTGAVDGSGRTFSLVTGESRLHIEYTNGVWNPCCPINLATIGLPYQINFTWTPFNATGVTGYAIFNSTANSTFAWIANTGNFTGDEGFYLHTGLAINEPNHYKTSAFSFNNATNSTTVFGITDELPDAPTISATVVSQTQIDIDRVAGASDGRDTVITYDLQCELNSAGGWLATVTDGAIVNFYNYTGLASGDDLVCQWRDTNGVGDSAWSSNATGTTFEFTTGTSAHSGSLVVGNVVFVEPTIGVVNGSPSPTVNNLAVYFNGSLARSEVVSQVIVKGATHQFEDLLYVEIDVGSPINMTVIATITNTTGNITVESSGENILREYATTDLLAETTSLGFYNFTIDTTDPDNRNLKVNRPFDNASNAWDLGCYSITGFNDADANWMNTTDAGFLSDTLSASSGQNVYITCYNPPAILFSTVSYGNLTGILAGFSGFDNQLGSWFGLPMIFMFVFFVAGLFGGRQSGTSMVVVLATIAILGGIGLLVIEEALWGIMLVLGALGLFASRVRF